MNFSKGLLTFIWENPTAQPIWIRTLRFLTLEETHQLDILLNIMETFQLSHIVNDLNWILNDLGKELIRKGGNDKKIIPVTED